MSEFAGKTIVISGGAEGIGLSIAMAMGKQGMNVVLGDIDSEQLKLAEAELQQAGVEVLTAQMDVTKLEQWQALADQAIERFGKIHMLVNNAGVGGGTGSIEQTDNNEWRWVMDVNLMGVINGTQVMVPHIKQHGEGGWLLNVASMAGMGGVPYGGAYTASKVAVVGMSESWYAELQQHNIQVSVLCPAFVKTRINLSMRNKQSDYKTGKAKKEITPQQAAMAAHMQKIIDNGLPVEIVGERVVEALKAKELYIFTHPNYRPTTQARAKAIDAAFERAAASPLLADVADQEIISFG
ncbi:SDR family NAD(P)-dependent oxidoreductase [Pseudomonas neustonica]|uniref:SDR family NAD(P)-dependent oxidoreductase n=1 Tax=Pseudomonas neustonica TaxID=2487346 RepID=A0ABX9XEI4_9PSED|nr:MULTISPECIES: SDR family NAD(P)-dependent oxidoreductase [Pseudomonas]ROZ80774.1 SDR family NAD(P)-dependent oxidoreductase [Pseudomonas sp. SSM44]ROZ82060.1 SDR family NAD(P)-dependent oxidoreductase [Pseudomonas neustonica]|tara:strand:+ start:5959 stop:6846 length:888 start_codon:yes stop_codon:yes gene_type:complete